VTVAGKQANADRIAARNQLIAVVLDLVNPIGTDGGRSAGEGRQDSIKLELEAGIESSATTLPSQAHL
jgi:hypothetical protein